MPDGNVSDLINDLIPDFSKLKSSFEFKSKKIETEVLERGEIPDKVKQFALTQALRLAGDPYELDFSTIHIDRGEEEKGIKDTFNKLKSKILRYHNSLKEFAREKAEDLLELLEKLDTEHTYKHLILGYLVNGKYTNRLGDEINRPDIKNQDNPDSEYLKITLEILNIFFYEYACNKANKETLDPDKPLRWLGKEDKEKDGKNWGIHRDNEKKIGALAYDIGAVIGRNLSSSLKFLEDIPFIHIPDEMDIVIPFLIGNNAKILAEVAVHKWLSDNGKVAGEPI